VKPKELVETMRSMRMEVKICRVVNERIMRPHEEKNQINSKMMQRINWLQRQEKNGSVSRQEEEGRHNERRDNYKRPIYSKSDIIIHGHQSPPYSPRKFYASKDSRSSPEGSLVRHQRRRYELDSLQGELKKIKTPSFDGEREMEYDDERIVS
jgi:hypothetical protein